MNSHPGFLTTECSSMTFWFQAAICMHIVLSCAHPNKSQHFHLVTTIVLASALYSDFHLFQLRLLKGENF